MELSIIIPSKTASNLVPCIRAIRAAGETCRIIVVDDGVDWDSFARGTDIPIWCYSGAKPFIFARNINLGIAAAGEDDVILLNDDAMLQTPGGFTRMWELNKRNPEYGIVSASTNNVGNPLQNHMPQWAHMDSFREEQRTLAFVCVLIRRAVLNDVGPMDERFVGYGMDDDDYCLRVRNAGYKLGIFDGCYCDHGSLVSTYRGGPQAGGDFRPNLKLFIEKWGRDNWGHTRANSQFADLFPKEG